jgi:hypothetical protein
MRCMVRYFCVSRLDPKSRAFVPTSWKTLRRYKNQLKTKEIWFEEICT